MATSVPDAADTSVNHPGVTTRGTAVVAPQDVGSDLVAKIVHNVDVQVVVVVDEGGLEAGAPYDAPRGTRVTEERSDVRESSVAAIAEQRQGVGELAKLS